MTFSDIVNAPPDQELVFDGEKLTELLVMFEGIRWHGAINTAEALRPHPISKIIASPMNRNHTYAEGAFFGYAAGRNWFYQE